MKRTGYVGSLGLHMSKATSELLLSLRTIGYKRKRQIDQEMLSPLCFLIVHRDSKAGFLDKHT